MHAVHATRYWRQTSKKSPFSWTLEGMAVRPQPMVTGEPKTGPGRGWEVRKASLQKGPSLWGLKEELKARQVKK